MRHVALALRIPLGWSSLFAVVALASRARAQVTGKTNSPPVISVSLPADATLVAGEVPWVKVTVTDPDGDLVYARLRGELQTDAFQPMNGEPSGTTREFALYTFALFGGRNELVVEAWDSFQPSRKVTKRVPFTLRASLRTRHATTVDFDGDGKPEIVLRSRLADVNGVADCGAFVVWSPGRSDSTPQPLVLHAASPVGGGQLGQDFESQMQLADLDGDGHPELIGWSRGTNATGDGVVSIWNVAKHLGQQQQFIPADATLTGNDPKAGVAGLGVVVRDFDRDGKLDLLASFPFADTPTVDAGELCFYKGGLGRFVGAVAPTATLRDSAPFSGDLLAYQGSTYHPIGGVLVVGDVTGDGVADVVAGVPYGDRTGSPGVGKVVVFDGASGWSGAVTPRAVLSASTTNNYNFLSGVSDSTGLFLHDVTGDGVLDVLAVSDEVGAGGSVYLWKGGSALSGSLDYDVRFRQLNYKQGDRMGRAAPGVGVLFDDFDGDGVDDVFAAAPNAKLNNAANAGSVYWFRGSSNLPKAPTETANFQLATPQHTDQLGSGQYGVRFADVTGDGALDLLLASAFVDPPNATYYFQDTGAVAVFAAKSGASGPTSPSALLADPNGTNNEYLGAIDALSSTLPGPMEQGGVACEDVTGDGVRDVVVVAPLAFSGNPSAFVFSGGAGLTGGTTPAPLATLNVANAGSLGWSTLDTSPVHVADVDGDGVRDVALVGVVYNYPPGSIDSIYCWHGGASLAGTPAPSATCTAQKPNDCFDGGRRGFDCVDTDGDLEPDVLVSAPCYDVAGTKQLEGAVYRYHGGAALTGSPTPDVFVSPFDVGAQGYGDYDYFLPPVDFDGDGHDDLILVEPWFETEFPDYQPGRGFYDVGAVRIYPLSGGATRFMYCGRILGESCAIGS